MRKYTHTFLSFAFLPTFLSFSLPSYTTLFSLDTYKTTLHFFFLLLLLCMYLSVYITEREYPFPDNYKCIVSV